jgi:hypothetical protein
MPAVNDHVQYYIPLAPFERLRISELKEILNTKNEAAAASSTFGKIDIQRTFKDWIWTDHMKELEKEFEAERLWEEHDGDRGRAYKDTCRTQPEKTAAWSWHESERFERAPKVLCRGLEPALSKT